MIEDTKRYPAEVADEGELLAQWLDERAEAYRGMPGNGTIPENLRRAAAFIREAYPAPVSDAGQFAADVQLKICRAFQPGDVVFIECQRPMTAEHRKAVTYALKLALENTGVRLLVLDDGMKVVTRSERAPEG